MIEANSWTLPIEKFFWRFVDEKLFDVRLKKVTGILKSKYIGKWKQVLNQLPILVHLLSEIYCGYMLKEKNHLKA